MSEFNLIRVLMVDDHKIIRDGVKVLLDKIDHITIVEEAGNGAEALQVLESNSDEVDVVLLDVGMPVMDGVEAMKRIQKDYPEVKVLALSMYDDEAHIIGMLQNGAAGYVLKTTGKTELAEAIERIASGQSYFAKEASSKMLDYISQNRFSKKKVKAKSPLTKREKEILRLISEEHTNNEIAEKLCLSPRTIETHRKNLLQKLQVKNTAGLVKYALLHLEESH